MCAFSSTTTRPVILNPVSWQELILEAPSLGLSKQWSGELVWAGASVEHPSKLEDAPHKNTILNCKTSLCAGSQQHFCGSGFIKLLT